MGAAVGAELGTMAGTELSTTAGTELGAAVGAVLVAAVGRDFAAAVAVGEGDEDVGVGEEVVPGLGRLWLADDVQPANRALAATATRIVIALTMDKTPQMPCGITGHGMSRAADQRSRRDHPPAAGSLKTGQLVQGRGSGRHPRSFRR